MPLGGWTLVIILFVRMLFACLEMVCDSGISIMTITDLDLNRLSFLFGNATQLSTYQSPIRQSANRKSSRATNLGEWRIMCSWRPDASGGWHAVRRTECWSGCFIFLVFFHPELFWLISSSKTLYLISYSILTAFTVCWHYTQRSHRWQVAICGLRSYPPLQTLMRGSKLQTSAALPFAICETVCCYC